MLPEPRSILAPNASAMTLGGTTVWLVGRRRVAIIDPGSADADHLHRLRSATADATATILLTHEHPDHSGGAAELGRILGAPVRCLADGTLKDGDVIDTDAGDLVTLATPGHAPDHAAFHWPAGAAIFCGDLMMGGLDTAVVAAPEGDIADYLDSLERIRALRPAVIYPAHGPAFTDPDADIRRYVSHRADRERQVLAALAAGKRTPLAIVDHVYGADLDPALHGFALAAVSAYLAHLRATGRLPDGVTP